MESNLSSDQYLQQNPQYVKKLDCTGKISSENFNKNIQKTNKELNRDSKDRGDGNTKDNFKGGKENQQITPGGYEEKSPNKRIDKDQCGIFKKNKPNNIIKPEDKKLSNELMINNDQLKKDLNNIINNVNTKEQILFKGKNNENKAFGVAFPEPKKPEKESTNILNQQPEHKSKPPVLTKNISGSNSNNNIHSGSTSTTNLETQDNNNKNNNGNVKQFFKKQQQQQQIDIIESDIQQQQKK